jgi:HTH-type transcriptional regulator, competence development regulator
LAETLGQRIRRMRDGKFGLREMAKKLEISPTYLSRIETNEEKTPPAEELLRKIADLLGDNFDELMSLAGRIPTDVKEYITKDPGLPQFLRTAREQGLTSKQLEEMLSRKGKK